MEPSELSPASAWPGHGARSMLLPIPFLGLSRLLRNDHEYSSKALPWLMVQINQCKEGNTSFTQHIFQQKCVFLAFHPSCLQQVSLTARSGCSLGARRGWGRSGTAGTDPAPRAFLGCQHCPSQRWGQSASQALLSCALIAARHRRGHCLFQQTGCMPINTFN